MKSSIDVIGEEVGVEGLSMGVEGLSVGTPRPGGVLLGDGESFVGGISSGPPSALLEEEGVGVGSGMDGGRGLFVREDVKERFETEDREDEIGVGSWGGLDVLVLETVWLVVDAAVTLAEEEFTAAAILSDSLCQHTATASAMNVPKCIDV